MESKLKLLMPLILGAAVDDKFYMNDLPKKKDCSTARVIPTPKKELREFNIKGNKIMAYSKKDAIIRLKHRK